MKDKFDKSFLENINLQRKIDRRAINKAQDGYSNEKNQHNENILRDIQGRKRKDDDKEESETTVNDGDLNYIIEPKRKLSRRQSKIKELTKPLKFPEIKRELERKLTERQSMDAGNLQAIAKKFKEKGELQEEPKERRKSKTKKDVTTQLQNETDINLDMEFENYLKSRLDKASSLIQQRDSENRDQKNRLSKSYYSLIENYEEDSISEKSVKSSRINKKSQFKALVDTRLKQFDSTIDSEALSRKTIEGLDINSVTGNLRGEKWNQKEKSKSKSGRSKGAKSSKRIGKMLESESDTYSGKGRKFRQGESNLSIHVTDKILRTSQILSDRLSLMTSAKEQLSNRSSFAPSELDSERSTVSSDAYYHKAYGHSPITQHKQEVKPIDETKLNSEKTSSSSADDTGTTNCTSIKRSNKIHRPAWQSGVHDILGKGAFDWQKRLAKLLPNGVRTSHGESALRFDLPIDMKLLETMTTEYYLTHHCRILIKREMVYDKPFIKHRPASRSPMEEFIYGSEIKQPLDDILLGSLTDEQYSNIKELTDFQDQQKISKKFYRGICAVTERLYFVNNFGALTEEAASLQKGYLEMCDFGGLKYKLDGVNVSEPLNKLIHSL